MPQRNANPWPFNRRKPVPKAKPVKSSTLTIGEAMAKAFRAGKESGDTGLFGEWLKQTNLTTRGNVLRARLEKEYRRGVEAPIYNAPPPRISSSASTPRSTEYKGRKIEAYKDGTFSVPSLDRDSRFDSLADAKRFIGQWKTNPKRKQVLYDDEKWWVIKTIQTGQYAGQLHLRSVRGDAEAIVPAAKVTAVQTNPTDRAHRYRANATPPEGPKQCAFCRTKSNVEVGHIDGHEEHNEPENLIWTCRSCNVLASNALKAAGLGRRTKQFNPTKSGGAANVGEWVQAVGAIVPHKGAKYAGSNYGLTSTMTTADAVAMIRATPAHKRREFAAKMGKTRAGRSKAAADERWNPKAKTNARTNPQGAAEALYESFHGKAPTETIVIEEQVHEHEHLTTLGELVEIYVETLTGLLACLTFDPNDVPLLAASEDGRQLYIEGGDQELDLKALKMDGDEWRKDRMVIGQFARPERKEAGRNRRKHNITYHTEKAFDKFQPIDYQHDLGEETGVRPMLEYEPRNQKLFIAGGQYRIEQPLFEMSPGIEN